MKELYNRLRHALRRLGLWPWPVLEQEDLHGGRLTLTWSAWRVPYRVELYALGPNVGDHEVTRARGRLGGQSARERRAFFRGMAFSEGLRLRRLELHGQSENDVFEKGAWPPSGGAA